MSSERRISQRAPLSCVFCARRKLRCSKTIPCTNCLERDMGARCHREVVTLSSEQHAELGGRQQRPRPRSTGRPAAARRHLLRQNTGSPQTTASTTSTTHSPVAEQTVMATPERSPVAPSVSDTFVSDISASYAVAGSPGEEAEARAMPLLAPGDDDDGLHAQDASTIQDLAFEAAMSLESLAWGNHPHDTQPLPSPVILALVEEVRAVIDGQQARDIVRFHTLNVAWMHNVVYMPFFSREVELYLGGQQRDAAWLSLYFAVLCTSVYYMDEREHRRLGLEDGFRLVKTLYRITIEAVMASDFMVLQSRHSLQAICVIVLCAHALGDTRRMKVLLACSNSIGENLGHRLHLLEDLAPNQPLSFEDHVNHEVCKRIWCFLKTQDWYLIATKKSYSIVPEHGTAPPPANCREDLDDVTDSRGGPSCLADLPLSVQTQSTYMLFLFKLTSIYRSLFDRLCAVHARGGSVSDSFDAVLAADAELEAAMGEIEEASRGSRSSSQCRRDDVRAAAQWRALVITSWHQRVMIHRTFFCRSFRDKRYHYSRFVCLAAARKILRSYLEAPGRPSGSSGPNSNNPDDDTTAPEIWTIPCHAISGCIIITLNALFTAEQYTLEKSDGDLMHQCLAALTAAPRPNSIVARGIQIVQRLRLPPPGSPHATRTATAAAAATAPRFRTLDPREIAQLARAIGVGGDGDADHLRNGAVEVPLPAAAISSAILPPSSQSLTGIAHFGDDELFMPWWYDTMHGYSL